MSKWMSSLAFLAVMAVGGTSLAATPAFDALDNNKDGVLSRSEASKVEQLDFAKADTNKDGMLDRSEYEAATS